MARQTGPQRFTPRTGSHADSRLRRALDGAIDTDRRNDETLEVNGGRLGVRVTEGGGLVQTKRGLELDKMEVGDKNLPEMALLRDLDQTATEFTDSGGSPPFTTDQKTELDAFALKVQAISDAYDELLAELRRTKRMRRP